MVRQEVFNELILVKLMVESKNPQAFIRDVFALFPPYVYAFLRNYSKNPAQLRLIVTAQFQD